MQDELIMNDLLTLSKNMCEILVHAAIEAADDKVKKTFRTILDEYIEIQGSIYKFMEQNGWYTLTEAPSSKKSKAAQKFKDKLDCN